MPKTMNVLAFALSLAAAGTALSAPPVASKEFTFDEKTNAELARRLKIPVYFAVPARARERLAQDHRDHRPADRLQASRRQKAKGDVGLRLVVAKRSGFAQRLGKSGLLQTGDILLTFRSEWGGAGAYPNIQMGITHTGFAYIKNGNAAQSRQPDGRRIRRPRQPGRASTTARSTSCTSSARAI